MKIHLNSERIKNIKNLTKKYVLITSISTLILTSNITDTMALSNYENQDILQYQISDENDYIYIENSNDLSIIDSFENLIEMSIFNSTIDHYIEKSNISILTIKNCSFIDSSIKLPNTITELEIDNTKINFEILTSLNSLKKITFKNMEFNSLEELKQLSNLTELNFDSCNIGNIAGIENLKALNSLSFVDTGIENIEQLEHLEKLNYLTLSHTYVTDLSPIKNLNITFLDITDSTNIKNLEIITEMKNLSNLIATNCEMSYTENIIKHINDKNIYSNISNEGLALQNEINTIISKIILPDMTEEEKIKAITNYVINTIEYDYRIYDDSTLLEEYNNYALKYALNGIGVCKNYAALTTALLRKANIHGYEQENQDHIWNIVKLNNEYYYIDATFIDTEQINELYESENFLSDETNFKLEHQSILIPSTLYNKIHGLTIPETEQNNNKIVLPNNLTTKNIALGGIIGIALALNSAFLIKMKKMKKVKQL